MSLWKSLITKYYPNQRQPINFKILQYSPTSYPAALNRQSRYPNTYFASMKEGIGQTREDVFEPSLQHYGYGFRLSDPFFETTEEAQAWQAARMDVIRHILEMVNASQWSDQLVLRGSLLLKSWLGEEGRNPGDIDWVVTPPSLDVNDRVSKDLFIGLITTFKRNPQASRALLDVSNIATDDIWTYDRAPGKRIVIPWTAAGLPPGTVQMDLVFKEELFSDPVTSSIDFPDEKRVTVLGAAQDISLAWKLMWLETDSYPQGKDLYDAVLLAERTSLSLTLLRQVMHTAEWQTYYELKPDFPMHLYIDWENFQLEYPWVSGTAHDWQVRLTKALEPTFAEATQKE